MTAPLTRRELLEDERRWALVFSVVAAVVAVLVSVYDVDDTTRMTLVALSALVVASYLIRAASAVVPAWVVLPVAGVVQAGAVMIDEQAEGHTFLVVMATFYVFFRESNRRAAALALALVLPSPFIQYVTDSVDSDGWLYWMMGYLICAWFGHLAFTLRTLAAELEAHRAEVAAQAVHRERRRIARDVHDAVGHSLSVVLLHLTAARRTIALAPEQAEASLAEAESVGREAMAEVRATMALLADGRPDGSTPVDGAATAGGADTNEATNGSSPDGGGVGPGAHPVPTVVDIGVLVDQYRSAGLAIELRVDGDPDRLPTRTGVAAYRIVQEALVNATRHGSGGVVEVGVAIGDETCRVTIENERKAAGGNAGARIGRGLGLVGMEERARSVGGVLVAGVAQAGAVVGAGTTTRANSAARPGSGRWRVEASLPVGAGHGPVRAEGPGR